MSHIAYIMYHESVASGGEGESSLYYPTICPSEETALSMQTTLLWRFAQYFYEHELAKMKTCDPNTEIVEAPIVREQIGPETFRESRGNKPWSLGDKKFFTKEDAQKYVECARVVRTMNAEAPQPSEVIPLMRHLDPSFATEFVVEPVEMYAP